METEKEPRGDQRSTPPRSRLSRRLIFIVAGFLAVVVAVGLWYTTVQTAAANSANCAARMRRIGQMLHLYSHEYRTGPSSMAALLDFIDKVAAQEDGAGTKAKTEVPRNRDVWHCPSSAATSTTNAIEDFILLPVSATNIDRLTPNTIVLHESARRHSGGMNVLHADGAVRFIAATDVEAMLADLNAAKNPPPSLQSKVGR